MHSANLWQFWCFSTYWLLFNKKCRVTQVNLVKLSYPRTHGADRVKAWERCRDAPRMSKQSSAGQVCMNKRFLQCEQKWRQRMSDGHLQGMTKRECVFVTSLKEIHSCASPWMTSGLSSLTLVAAILCNSRRHSANIKLQSLTQFCHTPQPTQ